MPRVYSTAGHMNWGRARARARTRAPHAGNCLGVASGVERSDKSDLVEPDLVEVVETEQGRVQSEQATPL